MQDDLHCSIVDPYLCKMFLNIEKKTPTVHLMDRNKQMQI